MRRKPTTTIFSPQALTVSVLADKEGRVAASRMLESCLAGPDIPLELIVQGLCSVPNLFEFVVSALPSGQCLVDAILDAYPVDPPLLETTHIKHLLQRLSSVMFALPPTLFPADAIRHDIGKYKLHVEHMLSVLAILSSTEFSTGTSAKKQKKPRQKHRENVPDIDTTPFRKLGSKVPLDDAEASRMAREIANDLKAILKFYLKLLREPFLAKQFKDAYIQTGSDAVVDSVAPQDAEVAKLNASAYPNVQPLKAALYFENADGFGEWRIIVGSDATRKLRELAKGDRKRCGIVLKKIRELSNGHFSDDNQKRLNGSTGVPVFEAKMQRDLRLVYQIDVLPDYDGNVERQVIKIYGIYTHTQLRRIWGTVGHHLAGKGKEYVQRCTFRNRPIQPGSDVYLPASFPPESQQTDTKHIPLVLSDEDKEVLHSLLVLDKYVTFSQAFFHSLITNEDVQHVFELSPYERRIVDCKTSCYVLGRSGTGKTTTMVFKMIGIQQAWEAQASGADMPKPRQIFVTKSEVLATKVEEYFAKLLESFALARYSPEDLKRMQARIAESRLMNIDETDRVDIPKRYSLLEDKHFPLFVTFDKLARLVAADVLAGDDPESQYAARLFMNTDEIDARDLFVSYEIFSETYWPHFPQPLTKGLEPWIVFSEFMGVIKGSEMSLACPGGFLDETTYCGLPARSNPAFANDRKTLYALFEAYCKLRRERRHHDVADRSHAVLRALLRGIPLQGKRVANIYVDEAQDNLLIDALLLRLLCYNPEGLFWAGDTAQTISAGSSFRFDDLKAFLYRVEQSYIMHPIPDRPITDPKVFQLAVNYRSHGGIVNCADSIIERITHFWPDAIDTLRPECGIVDGLKPVFFHGWDQDTVRFEQFLFGESDNHPELGAKQCILVRDRNAVKRLQNEVGEIGIIMALYDSKGLEFDDVLLYNFFEDSAVDVSRWRVLLNNVEGVIDEKELSGRLAPSFERDDGRFAGLKSLYVGVTRARKNLWIFDKSDKGEPMRMVWTLRNQIRDCTPETGLPRIVVSSDPAEWESSGRDLFRHQKYSQAMGCFTKALQPRMAAICQAYRLREDARAQVGVAAEKAQKKALLAAADAFMSSGNEAPPGTEQLQYYHNAGDCYVRAGDDRKAAIGYLFAQKYDLAARRYRKAGLFDQTLEILHKHSQEMSSECSDELYNVCHLYYCSNQDRNRNRPPFLFASFEEELEFLENYGFNFARASLLETHGRYMEAAELHLSENRPLDAIKDYLKERNSRDAIEKATSILLDALWCRCSFAIPSEIVAADQNVAELLKLACDLSTRSLDPLHQSEISMFQAIVQADFARLEKLALTFIKQGRNAAALLALDNFFSRLPALRTDTVQEISLFLNKFLEYTRLLHFLIYHTDPLGASSIRRLLCIQEVSNAEYRLQPDSFLYKMVAGDCDALTHLRTPALSKSDIVLALRKYLAQRLCERVTIEDQFCRDALAFSQCLTFSVNGYCRRINCPQEHVDLANLDSKRYNARLGIYLQHITILQLTYSVHWHSTKRTTMLFWLTRIYEAFNPQVHVQGSIADLILAAIPIHNVHGCLNIMKNRVWDGLYQLYPGRWDFLSTVLRLMSLLFAFDRSNALQCINRAHFNTVDERPAEFVYQDGGNTVVEDMVKFFDGTQQACISAGLKFLKHILESSQVVDLSVFCDCLERIVGKISVSWRLSFSPPLDGLVLPRGWFPLNTDKKDVDISLLLSFLDYVQELLMRLQSDIDSSNQTYILLRTRLTPILCHTFISRICRALCFLVHNVRDIKIGQKVKDVFITLRAAGPMQRTHPLYREYVWANGVEYLKAVVEYDARAGVVIKDIVRLLHKRRNSQRGLLSLPRVEDIHFTDPFEVPSLLASRGMLARSDQHADAPAAAYVPPIEVEAQAEDKIQPGPDAEYGVHDSKEQQEHAAAVDEPVLVHQHQPTEEDLTATNVQTAYRAYRTRHAAQGALTCSDQHAGALTAAYVPPTEEVEAGIEVEDEIQPEPDAEHGDHDSEEQQEYAAARDEPVLIHHHQSTEEEDLAATRIQTAYRAYRARHAAQVHAMGRGLKAQINKIFIICLKNVYAFGWGEMPYRNLYLWALPRMIACLDRAIATAHDVEDEIKRSFSEKSHVHIEELARQMIEINTLLKGAHNVRKSIGPDATMHLAHDKALMKQAFQDVKDIICRLPTPLPEIERDLHIADKLVMVEKYQTTAEKPSLNTEDLDSWDLYD